MLALGRDKEEFRHAFCMFAHTEIRYHRSAESWVYRCTHFLKRNWLTSIMMMNERKKLAGRKKTRSLEIYMYLPYDLILEVRNFYLSSHIVLTPIFQIFSYLHPIDLYHLGLTNKATRNIIMANHGVSLWTTVFRNDPTFPACPPDLTEPRWTALLFGPNICGVNSSRNLPEFD